MIAAAEDFSLTTNSVDDWLYDDDEATHIHEAGHAIAAAILNIRFHHVSVAHDDEKHSNGRVDFYGSIPDWLRGNNKPNVPHALNGCISLMAGMTAQLRWQGDDADLKICGAGDRIKLDMAGILIASTINPGMILITKESPEVIAIRDWAWREACMMMANPRVWRAVHVLGFHLLENETASEREVAEIVRAERATYKPKRFKIFSPSQIEI